MIIPAAVLLFLIAGASNNIPGMIVQIVCGVLLGHIVSQWVLK